LLGIPPLAILILMDEQIEKVEAAAKKTWTVVIAWVGGITALIGFVASVAGGINWFLNHHRRNAEYQAKMALAQTQTSQQQYQAAIETYREILKDDPLKRHALDAQLDTAMMWTENFSVYVREGKDEGDASGSALDDVLPILTAGFMRVKQPTRSADVEAHLGWAHFLNAKMAQRENDSVAVADWHSALSTDPQNVYAHAMLGNWMLQSGGDLPEAVEHFQNAVRTGRARLFVRSLQIGGLLNLEVSGARAEIMRVGNEMRKEGEQLDPGLRHRIASWCFDPIVTNHREFIEALSAVSSDDAWKTYLWLTGGSQSDSSDHDLKQQFVQANLFELSGSREAALSEYRQLKQELRDRPGSLRDQVGAAITRLTHD
jgi:tetratricopeptide (TPR) repeat protein